MIDKTEYINWYNLAKETINNEKLIPKRIDKEIIGLVSKEDWLLFAPKGLSKEEVVNSENPNIFFDITSRKKNSNMARLGLTFNNLKSYEKFKTIMRGYNKEIKDKVTKKLLKLDNSWKIEISSKIKDYNYAQSPEYTPKMEWNTNQINDNIIDELVKNRREYKRRRSGN